MPLPFADFDLTVPAGEKGTTSDDLANKASNIMDVRDLHDKLCEPQGYPFCAPCRQQLGTSVDLAPDKVMSTIGHHTTISTDTSPGKSGYDESVPSPAITSNTFGPTEGPLAPAQIKPLVQPKDQEHATRFSFAVLSEVEPCKFEGRDKKGKRSTLPIGFPGLACRYCRGAVGRTGRYFPSTIKTMSDTKKTLMAIYRHLRQCGLCPGTVLDNLEQRVQEHSVERLLKKGRGSQKAFFRKIWNRLHHNNVNLLKEDPCSQSQKRKAQQLESAAAPSARKECTAGENCKKSSLDQ